MCKRCINGNDRFVYTGPIQGVHPALARGGGQCDPTGPGSACSEGWTEVAHYHSHPSDRGFSYGDKNWAKFYDLPLYVTRHGHFHGNETERFDPTPGGHNPTTFDPDTNQFVDISGHTTRLR